MTKLTSTSACDNVLLEYRLGNELRERGMLILSYPIFVGDKDSTGTYKNYFASGCHPNLSLVDKVVVSKIEDKLFEHLSNHALGSPMVENMSVASIINGITADQGAFIEGSIEEACKKIDSDVVDMMARVRLQRRLESDVAAAGVSADANVDVSEVGIVDPANSATTVASSTNRYRKQSHVNFNPMHFRHTRTASNEPPTPLEILLSAPSE